MLRPRTLTLFAIPLMLALFLTFPGSTPQVTADDGAAGDADAPADDGAPDAVAQAADTIELVRLAGENRYRTATVLSQRSHPDGAQDVFLATGERFPDALGGGSAAAAAGAPVLLTPPGALPAEVAEEIGRLAPERITVLGGPAAIAPSVVAQLEATTGAAVTRLGARDRYGTAAAISAAHHPEGADVVYLATGERYPDALAGAVLAAREDAPILLTQRDVLAPATAEEIARLQPSKVVALGGAAAISEGVLAQAAGTAGTASERIFGSDRYETAVAVSKRLAGGTASTVFVTTGTNWADAMVAAAPAHASGAPVLLVPHGDLPRAVTEELTRLQPSTVVVLGGYAAVPYPVIARIATVLDIPESALPEPPPQSPVSPPQGPEPPPESDVATLPGDGSGYPGLVMHAVRGDTPRGAYDAGAANNDVRAYPGASVNPSFWNFHGGGTPAVIEDNPFGDGGRVLRIVTPSQGPLSNPDKSRLINQPTLIGNFILSHNHPVLNLEYDIRFGNGYHLTSPWGPQGGNTVAYGGKLPGLGGTADDGLPPVSCGAAGDINNGFSARTMWRNNAQLSSYLYWRDKTSSCGHNYAFGPTLTPDRWYTVRQRITMNTPGQADGRVERWVNGVKQEDVHGFRFRAADQTFGVNRVIMQFYHGGNTWDWGHPGGAPGSPANNIYFRNFRVWTGQ
jgi:putative cell wall-binding protein